MAESEAQIVNAGLTYIGHSRFVDDLDDENDDSAERAVAVEAFATDRDFVLRAFDWPFATARVRPAQITPATLALGEVPGGWGYAYARPADCLKLRAIYPGVRNPREDEQVSYKIERDTTLKTTIILTDESAPELVYTARVDDVSQFAPDFDDALAWRLAIKLAAGLIKEPKPVQLALAGYQNALATAIRNALQENRGEQPPPPNWIASRA